MIATETRPRADRHGRCQTLLPEQAWHLASCQRYATLKPDGFGKDINGTDLKSKLPRSVEVMRTTVDIYHKERSSTMSKGPCTKPVSRAVTPVQNYPFCRYTPVCFRKGHPFSSTF